VLQAAQSVFIVDDDESLRTPVKLITGHDRFGMEQKAMRLGAVAYLVIHGQNN
jgi:hypothetical protein